MSKVKYKGPFGQAKGELHSMHKDEDKNEVIILKKKILEKLKDPDAQKKAAHIIETLLKKSKTKK